MDVIGTSATKIAEGVDEIEYAYAKAVNSAWVSLCRKPNKVSVAITLPKEYDEEKLKDIARLCDGLAKENDLQISGGSTIVSDKVTDVIVSFTVFYDEVLKNQSDDFKKVRNQPYFYSRYGPQSRGRTDTDFSSRF